MAEDDERPGGLAGTLEGGGGEAAGVVVPLRPHHGGPRVHRLKRRDLQPGRVRARVAACQSKTTAAVRQIEASLTGLHDRPDAKEHARQLRLDVHRVGERLAEDHIDVDELLGEAADLVREVCHPLGDPLGHGVERPGELPDLVVAAQVDLLPGLSAGDADRGRGQLLERPADTSGHKQRSYGSRRERHYQGRQGHVTDLRGRRADGAPLHKDLDEARPVAVGVVDAQVSASVGVLYEGLPELVQHPVARRGRRRGCDERVGHAARGRRYLHPRIGTDGTQQLLIDGACHDQHRERLPRSGACPDVLGGRYRQPPVEGLVPCGGRVGPKDALDLRHRPDRAGPCRTGGEHEPALRREQLGRAARRHGRQRGELLSQPAHVVVLDRRAEGRPRHRVADAGELLRDRVVECLAHRHLTRRQLAVLKPAQVMHRARVGVARVGRSAE